MEYGILIMTVGSCGEDFKQATPRACPQLLAVAFR
jgi:hypothetical protein